jgi:hypothetical protein
MTEQNRFNYFPAYLIQTGHDASLDETLGF